MSGRQSNILKPKDERRPRPNRKRKAKNELNALAIAEKQYPSKPKIRRHRLGEEEPDNTRKRRIDDDEDDFAQSKRPRQDDDGSEDGGGSDSDGNEWQIGVVNSDNDSEIDSDDALGESDEEHFEGFAFRGSSHSKRGKQTKTKPKSREAEKQNGNLLDEEFGGLSDEDSEGGEEDEEDDDLGEDAVDLATAWDMNDEESDSETAKKSSKRQKRTLADDDDDLSSGSEEEEDDDDDDDEDEEGSSDLSISDNEAEDNTRGLSKLKKFVNSLEPDSGSRKDADRKKTILPGGDPTEFGLTSTRKLTVADLLPTISDSRMKGALKHMDTDEISTKKSTGIPGKLDAPLPKRQQDRIDRTAAYKQSKEALSKWIETVKTNRRAEHLHFPLPEPDRLQESRIVDSKPRTDLETTIQNILAQSGLAEANGQSAEDRIQEFEELEAKKIPLEEIQERRAELRKARELLFREEVRSKRIKKIKSKSYRRVHRKERERNDLREHEALAAAGVDLEEENREHNDRIRAEARMGSKHRESKYAKSLKQTGRAAWDEDARTEMAELARREEELHRRMEGRRIADENDDEFSESSSSGDDSDSVDGFASDFEERKLKKKLDRLASNGETDADSAAKSGPYANLLSMKFMQQADAARKEANDSEIKKLNRELAGEDPESETEINEPGRQKFGASTAEPSANAPSAPVLREFEEPNSEDDEDTRMNDAGDDVEIRVNAETTQGRKAQRSSLSKNKHTSREPQEKPSPDVEDNPWLSERPQKGRRKKGVPDASAEISLIDNGPSTTTTTTIEAAPRKSAMKEVSVEAKRAPRKQDHSETESDYSEPDEDDEDKMPVLLQNEDLIKKAFAGDQVLETFKKEKQETVKDEDDKVVEDTLPGWGSWAGNGLSKADKKKVKRTFKTVEGIKPEQRKDAKLNRVIINEKTVKKVTFFPYHVLARPVVDI